MKPEGNKVEEAVWAEKKGRRDPLAKRTKQQYCSRLADCWKASNCKLSHYIFQVLN
jgi:hypothetical protein